MSNIEILTKFIENGEPNIPDDLFPSVLKIRRGNRVATYWISLPVKEIVLKDGGKED